MEIYVTFKLEEKVRTKLIFFLIKLDSVLIIKMRIFHVEVKSVTL